MLELFENFSINIRKELDYSNNLLNTTKIKIINMIFLIRKYKNYLKFYKMMFNLI
jgi:hypothetical protein